MASMHKRFSHLDHSRGELLFQSPLIEASIVNRPNRYIAYAKLSSGETVKCHTPVSGRIGGLTIDGLPCLLSGPYGDRSTSYTVEAIGLGQKSDQEFQWLAINQTAVNSYVKEFALGGLMEPLFEQSPSELALTLRAEKSLADSRIDFFRSGLGGQKDLWVEVKTPLIKLHTAIPSSIPVKTDYGSDSVGGRTPKQMLALQKELAEGKRVALLAGFGYRNTLTTSDELRLKDNLDLDAVLSSNRKLGLEAWQFAFEIEPAGILYRGLKRL